MEIIFRYKLISENASKKDRSREVKCVALRQGQSAGGLYRLLVEAASSSGDANVGGGSSSTAASSTSGGRKKQQPTKGKGKGPATAPTTTEKSLSRF
jgi:hypothetical protein